MVTVEF